MSDSDLRNHPATPLRRRQALEQGNVARSHELTSAIVLLCGLAALGYLGVSLVGRFSTMLQDQLGGRAWLRIELGDVSAHTAGLAWGLAGTLLPVFVVLMVVTAITQLAQARFVFFPERAMFDPQRVSPVQGFTRIFSLDSATRSLLGIVKLASVAALTVWCGVANQESILRASGEPLSLLGATLSGVLFWTCLKIGSLLIVLGAADYAYQWWRHERSLRMTTEELRQELRSQNGHPQIAARRKRSRQQTGTETVSRVGD